VKSYQIGPNDIGEQTTMGYNLLSHTYPTPYGNRFSVDIDNKHIQIANMHVENYRKLFELHPDIKSVNVNVDELGNGFIDDKNISDNWYLKE